MKLTCSMTTYATSISGGHGYKFKVVNKCPYNACITVGSFPTLEVGTKISIQTSGPSSGLVPKEKKFGTYEFTLTHPLAPSASVEFDRKPDGGNKCVAVAAW